MASNIALTPAQFYSPAEWEQKRTLITQLYRDERKPLHDLRIILAQHAFRPTVPMLKKRIKKWDLGRNHKQPDMLHALKIALPREAQGKKTLFVIRGRVVSFKEVKHYFCNKGVRDLRSLVNDAGATIPTTRIECHTPEPNSADEDERDRFQEIISGSESCGFSGGTVVLSDLNQVDQALPQPTEMGQLNRLLLLGRNYYGSIFEKRNWKNQQEIFELGSLEKFYHNMFVGQSLLESNKVQPAFKHFECAFDLVQDLLAKETLLLLPYLYHMLLPNWKIHRQEVFLQLLEFTAKLIQETHPQLQALRETLITLHSMSIQQRGKTSTRVFQSILNHLKVEFQQDKFSDQDLQRFQPNIICSQVFAEFTQQGTVDNYNLTSIAIQRLTRDAELVDLHASDEQITVDISRRVWHHEEKFGWHRDFKPENVLWFPDEISHSVLKFADFGLSHFDSSTPTSSSTTYIPSAYRAGISDSLTSERKFFHFTFQNQEITLMSKQQVSERLSNKLTSASIHMLDLHDLLFQAAI